MNKISLYFLLVLIYLGLSKSFSPSEQKTPYLVNEKVFSNFFSRQPLSIIHIDSFKTGFLIKTYFQKYKVVHGFTSPENIVVRTSQDFWQKNLKNLGMSLFRRSEEGNESVVPLPPGSLYLGNPAFGTWRYTDAGIKVWRFHRAYRHFPSVFEWGSFRPSQKFYNQMKVHEKNERPFYGLENEFGRNGRITSQAFKLSYEKDTNPMSAKFAQHLKELFKIPPWKREN